MGSEPASIMEALTSLWNMTFPRDNVRVEQFGQKWGAERVPIPEALPDPPFPHGQCPDRACPAWAKDWPLQDDNSSVSPSASRVGKIWALDRHTFGTIPIDEHAVFRCNS